MGKRTRRRGEHGKGTRQRYKERALGLQIAGVSKPMLDAMNEVSLERFGVGIGVVVQEEERLKNVAASFTGGRWPWSRARRNRRRYEAEAKVWTDRLREISVHVAAQADSQEVERFAARR